MLKLADVRKSFRSGELSVEVLKGIDLEVGGGESIVLTGPSGSGKSTLLHLIGTLDRPTSGTIEIRGRDPWQLPEPELARFRNRTIGFVFQDAHLLPQYSVLENVLLPTLPFPVATEDPKSRAKTLLDRVGLAHRLAHRPAELSGGERQRAAVARALINAPNLLLCDEPTGSLDGAAAESVADLLLELQGEEGATLIVVTHSQQLAARFDRRSELREGRCVEA